VPAGDDGLVLPGDRTLGCLLVHGLTATPDEMRPLAERLAAAGFPVRVVRLAGHDTSPDDLARTRWQDWLASVEAGFAALREATSRVAVVGFSTGGLLALRLAAERGAEVEALVLCAAALSLRTPGLWALPWLCRVPAVRRRLAMLPKGGRDIADPEARVTSRAYDRIPVGALLDLLDLQHRVGAELGRVRQPALLLHGRHDHTVPLDCQERLRRGLGGRWIEAHVLERSWHVLPEDHDRDEVGRLAADFLGRVERDDPGAARP